MKSSMYETKSYTEHFMSLKSPLKILDKNSRDIKSKKIFSVINDFSNTYNLNLKNLDCLDIGCSSGLITFNLSHYFKSIIGLDTDKNAIAVAKKSYNKKKLKFAVGSGLNIPFEDESFDAVICNHVYEHVPDYKKLFSEIYRVLKKNGFCYLSAGNKYVLMEGHYNLPFLSWLPQSLANYYLRITKKGKIYEEKHKSYFEVIRALKQFEIIDYTINIIKNPEKYEAVDMIKPNSLIAKIPRFLFYLFKPLLPVYIFILRKH